MNYTSQSMEEPWLIDPFLDLHLCIAGQLSRLIQLNLSKS